MEGEEVRFCLFLFWFGRIGSFAYIPTSGIKTDV